MARKGILSTNITPQDGAQTPRQRMMPSGAVGALQSSLTKLQENAVQEIDPNLIDSAGMEDRLGSDHEDHKRLVDSIQTYGQQVPILLRPHPSERGRYQIVYGRRRLQALRELGLPAKAMVRQLDDHALVMAQGQENNTRTDLSFIEKASFAAQLDAAGYERQAIADALAIDLPMVSRMLKVGKAFELDFLREIGRAPSIGRERWMQLAGLFQEPTVRSKVRNFMNRPEFLSMGSDDRFNNVLLAAQNKHRSAPPTPPSTQKSEISSADGTQIATMRTTEKAVTLNIKAQGFNHWIAENAEDLMGEWFARWQSEQSK